MRMTSRERFLTTMRGESPDRLFRLEWGAWVETTERWRGEGFPEGISFGDYFELDRLEMVSIGPSVIEAPIWPPFERKIIEEDHAWVIAREPTGIVTKTFKQNEESPLRARGETGPIQHIRFPVTDRADWQDLKKRLAPANAGRTDDLLARVAPHSSPSRDYVLIVSMEGAYAHPRDLMGTERLSTMIYDDPSLLREIEENSLALHKLAFDAVLKRAEVDAVYIWEDMAYRNGPLLSPHHFREFMLPFYKEMTSFLRARGVPSIWVDSDGDITDLIELFLEGGADLIVPFEVQAGMDVVEVRRRYGEGLGICGGIDKRPLAVGKEAIDAEIGRVRPLLESGKKFIPALDHSVPPNVSFEDFCYYVERLRSFE